MIKIQKEHISLKLIILGCMFILFLVGLFASFSHMMQIFLYLSFAFLLSSVVYYAFWANENDSTVLMSMWKLYFSVITLMFIFLYTMDTNASQMKIDYYKTKLSLETETNSSDLHQTFKTYTHMVTQYLDAYKVEEVNISKAMNPEKKSAPKEIRSFYGNLALLVMNIMTLFMFLWAIKELSFFKTKNPLLKNTEFENDNPSNSD